MSAGRGARWQMINGAVFRIDPRYRTPMTGTKHDAQVLSFLSKAVKPGAIYFDIAANLGLYVLQIRPLGRTDWARGRLRAKSRCS